MHIQHFGLKTRSFTREDCFWTALLVSATVRVEIDVTQLFSQSQRCKHKQTFSPSDSRLTSSIKSNTHRWPKPSRREQHTVHVRVYDVHKLCVGWVQAVFWGLPGEHRPGCIQPYTCTHTHTHTHKAAKQVKPICSERLTVVSIEQFILWIILQIAGQICQYLVM